MRIRSRSTQLMLATVLALALGAVPLIAGGAGATTNSAADKAASAPSADFSGLVKIGGGRKIYMTCRGKGSPTVVLVSGLGNAADIWSVTTDPKKSEPSSTRSPTSPGSAPTIVPEPYVRTRSSPLPPR